MGLLRGLQGGSSLDWVRALGSGALPDVWLGVERI